MKLGAYTAVLHDKPLAEALGILRDLGLESAETNSGGFLPASHRVRPDEPGAVSLGGRYTLSCWPQNSSWDFVAVGRGHDVEFWTRFLAALEKVDPDIAVNIEHEDQELGQIEGLRSAARTLLEAARGI
jgi:sugar phosphate isomerase/epimerase